MIPALESKTGLIEMAVRPAARDHILAWDAGQRLVANCPIQSWLAVLVGLEKKSRPSLFHRLIGRVVEVPDQGTLWDTFEAPPAAPKLVRSNVVASALMM